jgi:hypothetical protein
MRSGAKAGAEAGAGAVSTAGDFLKNPFNFQERKLEREAKRNIDISAKIDPTTGKVEVDPITKKPIQGKDYAEYKRLSDLDIQDLFEEAAKYGLRPSKNKEKLIREIIIQKNKKKIRLKKLQDKAEKLGAKGRSLSEKEKAEMKALGMDVSPSGEFSGDSGTEIPYIKYLDETTADISSWLKIKVAIPVHVLNFPDKMGGGGPDYSKVIIPTPGTPPTPATLNPDLEDSALDTYRMSDAKGYKYNKTSAVFPGADRRDPFVALVDKPLQAMNIKGAMALRVFDQSNIILAQAMEKKVKANSAATAAQAEMISGQAYSMGIRMIKKEAATPVYIVNKNPIPTDAGAILKAALKALFTALIPFAGGKIADAVLGSVTGAGGIDQLLSVVGLASGGRGKGLPRYAQGVKKSSVSSFIAGDSLNGKPNEEQVNID